MGQLPSPLDQLQEKYSHYYEDFNHRAFDAVKAYWTGRELMSGSKRWAYWTLLQVAFKTKGDTGTAHVCVEELCLQTRMSNRQVRQCLAALVDAGAITTAPPLHRIPLEKKMEIQVLHISGFESYDDGDNE